MRRIIAEAANSFQFAPDGERTAYEDLQVVMGGAIIEAREATGLVYTQEDLNEYGMDVAAYNSPSEVGRMPLRLAIGMIASTAVVTVARLKGWA